MKILSFWWVASIYLIAFRSNSARFFVRKTHLSVDGSLLVKKLKNQSVDALAY